MAPKKDVQGKAAAAKATAEAKKAAKAEDKARKEALKAQSEQEEAQKQKNAICNFVTQGKHAAEGTPLKRAYDEYKDLPLHSEMKTKMALNWKNDKSCSWLNSFIEQHKTNKSITTSRGSGYRTMYWIAKELGMQPDSDVFANVLAGYQKFGPEVWDESDPAELPFKQAGLDAYMYAEKGLEVSKKVEGHEEMFQSVSNAKKCKLALVDVAGGGSSSSADVPLQINHELWHACNAMVKEVEGHLQLYTSRLHDVKELQVKYLSLDEASPDVQSRKDHLAAAVKMIQDMEICSLQLVSAFSQYAKDDDTNLGVFRDKLAEHLKQASELHDAVSVRIRKNAAWLEAQ